MQTVIVGGVQLHSTTERWTFLGASETGSLSAVKAPQTLVDVPVV